MKNDKLDNIRNLIKTRYIIIISIVLGLMAGFLGYNNHVNTLDNMISDAVYQKINRDDKNSDIKIISIDQATIQKLGNYSDWSRSTLADIIKKLDSFRSRPAAIGVALDLHSGKDSAGDNALVSACKKYGNVCLSANLILDDKKMPGHDRDNATGSAIKNYSGVASKGALEMMQPPPDNNNDMQMGDKRRDENSTPPPKPSASPSEKLNKYAGKDISGTILPFDDILPYVTTGFVNLSHSNDNGYVKDAVASINVEGTSIDSFSVALYKMYKKARGQKYTTPKLDDRNAFGFNFSKKSGEYDTYSFVDVLNGKIDLSEFKKSIVIIGDYTSDDEKLKVPNQKNETMQNVEVQANIIEALQNSKTVESVPKIHLSIFYAVFVFFLFLATSYITSKRTMIAAVIFVVIQLFAACTLNHYGYFVPLLIPIIFLIIVVVLNLMIRYILERKKKSDIENVFKKYVDEQVVQEIVGDGNIEAKVGGERKDIAVLFIDIRGFTPLSESLDPEQVVDILNQYLTIISNAVYKNNGTLDKFIGDAAMAVFNSPSDLPDYEFQAVKTAWDILSGAEKLDQECAEKYQKHVAFGIGINCGEAVIGNIGCDKRMDFTAIGDTVNTAARLEGRAKPGQILISESLYKRVKDKVEASFAGEYELKGKKQPVKTYQIDSLKVRSEWHNDGR